MQAFYSLIKPIHRGHTWTLLLLVFLGASSLEKAFGQLGEDTTQARLYYEKGRKYGAQALYDSSDYFLDLSAKIYQQHGDSVMYLAGKIEKISNLIYKSDYKAASKMADEVLQEIKRHRKQRYGELAVDIYLDMAGISFRAGEYQDAISYSDSSLQWVQKYLPKDHVKIGVNYNIQAILNRRMGNMEKAITLFDKALANFILNKDNQGIAFVKTNMGNVFEAQGYIRRAEKYYKESVILLKDLYGEEHPNVATCYDNLSNIYLQLQDFEQSAFYANQTIRIVKKVFGDGHEIEGHSYLNLGSLAERKNQLLLAISYTKKAEKIYLAIDNRHHYLIHVYQGLGDLYLKLGKPDSAALFYDQHSRLADVIFKSGSSFQHAIVSSNLAKLDYKNGQKEHALLQYGLSQALLLKNKLAKHPQYSNNLLAMAEIQRPANSRKALEYVDMAINACVDSAYYGSSNLEIPTFNNLYSEINLIKALALKAQLLNNGSVDNYKLASQYYLLIDSVADLVRLTYPREQTKLSFTVFMSDIYNQAFELAYQAYVLQPVEGWIKKALYFSEKRKALILLEQINSKKALKFGQIDSLVQQREVDLQDKMVRIKNEMREAQEQEDPAKLHELSKTLFFIEASYDSLLRYIDKNFEKYYHLNHQIKIASLEQIRLSVLDGETAMLEYFTTPKSSYCIYIDEDTAAIYALGSSETIRNNIFSYLDKIQKIREGYETVAYELYQQLWEPVGLIGQFKKVKVIPSGFISYLPFEMLLSKPSNDQSNKLKPWLIQQYQISYAYSGSFLMNNPVQRHKRAPLALSIAPDFLTNQAGQLQALAGAKEESDVLKHLFAGASLVGQEATESKFKELSGNFSVIHLATHALLDDINPMHSRLVFSQGRDSLNDGYLYNYELYNMDLKADLVTLSACNTGIGTMVEGEGIISLARGFAFAGSPSIVMSLWPAADKVTADLMKSFYENLKFGLDKDEALRLAKIQFLQEQNNLVGHPYYWGSFILMGQTDPIRIKNLYGYYIAFGAILLFGFIWVLRRRAGNQV